MKSKIIIMLIILVIMGAMKANIVLGQEECTPQPPTSATGNGAVANPGGDATDDNYSSSSGILREYNLAPEAVVQTDGYWEYEHYEH